MVRVAADLLWTRALLARAPILDLARPEQSAAGFLSDVVRFASSEQGSCRTELPTVGRSAPLPGLQLQLHPPGAIHGGIFYSATFQHHQLCNVDCAPRQILRRQVSTARSHRPPGACGRSPTFAPVNDQAFHPASKRNHRNPVGAAGRPHDCSDRRPFILEASALVRLAWAATTFPICGLPVRHSRWKLMILRPLIGLNGS
jgi:hypothetical protein